MISRVEINKFKCFGKKQHVHFTIPDQKNIGSGLTVFVGDNNSGKTAVLSVFGKLKSNEYIYDEEKYKGEDVKIVYFDADGNSKIVKNAPNDATIQIEGNGEFSLVSDDIHYIKDNKIWASDFGKGRSDYQTFRRNTDYSRNNPDGQMALLLSQMQRENNEVKNEFDKLLSRVIDNFTSWNISASGKRGQHITYKMLSGENQDIDYSLGSGNLNIFKIIFGLVDPSSKLVVIDEPEAFLHPIAQEKLAKVILEKSKNKQIIITTHSPFMLKGLISEHTQILIFKRSGKAINIKDVKDKNFGLFNISPTFNEITYYAYGLPTVEFHNELYGFVQSNLGFESIKKFDDHLVDKEGDTIKHWIHSKKTNYRGLSTYIRTYIHHPEDREKNKKYSELELKKSITFLISLMKR